jgi:hypothetical protein
LAIGFALLGCTPPEEPVSSYKVKKHELIQVSMQPAEESGADLPLTVENPTDRILGAVVLFKDIAWYIKGAAPVGDWPDDASEEFGKLISSLKFESADKPTWELSDKWVEKPGSSSMRAADLVLGKVTFSVIKLPNTGPNDRDYLLSNMNRWRRQVSLGPIDSAELANTSQKISTADGESATVVDYLGKQDNASMPPMMRNGGGAMARGPFQTPPKPAASGAAKGKPGFTSSPPAGWTLTKSRMFQKARYIVKAGEESGFASVSQAGGDVMMNVNRWRGQVGLPTISKQEEVNADPVKVGGVDGILVRLIGEEKGLIVAMVPDIQSGHNWFFKLEGPSTFVESQAEAFSNYLDTVKFE